jgi:putative spermidine/putrescine transport system permease protein
LPTSFYLLNAFDLHWTADGSIGRLPPGEAGFVRVFVRTFFISAAVTLATLLLAFRSLI